jgi:hypothetical protein
MNVCNIPKYFSRIATMSDTVAAPCWVCSSTGQPSSIQRLPCSEAILTYGRTSSKRTSTLCRLRSSRRSCTTRSLRQSKFALLGLVMMPTTHAVYSWNGVRAAPTLGAAVGSRTRVSGRRACASLVKPSRLSLGESSARSLGPVGPDLRGGEPRVYGGWPMLQKLI